MEKNARWSLKLTNQPCFHLGTLVRLVHDITWIVDFFGTPVAVVQLLFIPLGPTGRVLSNIVRLTELILYNIHPAYWSKDISNRGKIIQLWRME